MPFSFLALCEEGDSKGRLRLSLCHRISIHALCEEGDEDRNNSFSVDLNFYPRPLRGGRPDIIQDYVLEGKFLSTPSARRATSGRAARTGSFCISIHALCEEGDGRVPHRNQTAEISIHALCEEGDLCPPPPMCRIRDFYPRPLRGGRPMHRLGFTWAEIISIHALCEEGDSKNRDKISIFKQIIQHSARI